MPRPDDDRNVQMNRIETELEWRHDLLVGYGYTEDEALAMMSQAFYDYQRRHAKRDGDGETA